MEEEYTIIKFSSYLSCCCCCRQYQAAVWFSWLKSWLQAVCYTTTTANRKGEEEEEEQKSYSMHAVKLGSTTTKLRGGGKRNEYSAARQADSTAQQTHLLSSRHGKIFANPSGGPTLKSVCQSYYMGSLSLSFLP